MESINASSLDATEPLLFAAPKAGAASVAALTNASRRFFAAREGERIPAIAALGALLFIFAIQGFAQAPARAPRKTLPGPASNPVKLQVSPLPVPQGGLLYVRLPARTPLDEPSCEWLGKTYPLYAIEGGYRSALPVDRLQKVGTFPLVIRARGVEGPVAARQVRVTPLSTGAVQIVHLTPETMAAEKDPRIEEDSKRIRELLATRTPEALWEQGFMAPSKAPGKNFGKRRKYIEILAGGKRGSSFEGYHRGLDFPLSAGTPVPCAGSGKVLAAELFVLSGNTVLVDHGEGIITGYFHLSEFRVKAGERVEEGQVVGLVGTTGRSTGPHLHWSVYAQGQAVNPAALLRLPPFFRQ